MRFAIAAKLIGSLLLGALFGAAAQNWVAFVMGTGMFFVGWDPTVAAIKKKFASKTKPAESQSHEYVG